MLMLTYGLSSPSTVKKYPEYVAAAGALPKALYSFLYLTFVGKSTTPVVPLNVLTILPLLTVTFPVPLGVMAIFPLEEETILLPPTSKLAVRLV